MPDTAFVYRRRVEFAETDMMGIVHFAVFYRYLEEAEHAMWRDAGLSIVSDDIGFPRVASSLDFHSPLRFQDEFEVAISIAAITRSTIRYTCALTKGETRIASGSMTIACVGKIGPGPLKAIPIPDRIVSALRTRLAAADAT